MVNWEALGTCLNDLPRVAAWQCGGRESNRRSQVQRPNHNATELYVVHLLQRLLKPGSQSHRSDHSLTLLALTSFADALMQFRGLLCFRLLKDNKLIYMFSPKYYVSQKRPPCLFFNNTVKNQLILITFGTQHFGEIWHRKNINLPISPVICSRITLGSAKSPRGRHCCTERWSMSRTLAAAAAAARRRFYASI